MEQSTGDEMNRHFLEKKTYQQANFFSKLIPIKLLAKDYEFRFGYRIKSNWDGFVSRFMTWNIFKTGITI